MIQKLNFYLAFICIFLVFFFMYPPYFSHVSNDFRKHNDIYLNSSKIKKKIKSLFEPINSVLKKLSLDVN